jgi:glutamyl-tRNA synthetase/glutamyl-Q tRNA(Asp) synthetase
VPAITRPTTDGPLRTRFAPSVTGHLHLGHLVNAIHVWGLARAWGGEVLLRLEDHDRRRFDPAFESSILDDLDWLGLRPDLGPTASFRAGTSPFRQSDNDARYVTALEALRRTDLIYACACSRAALPADAVPGEERRYPGSCRERGLPPGPGRRLRVRMGPGIEAFDDLRLGPERQDPDRQCGDFVIRDGTGDWTYQFAVVVDDLVQEISLVVRGEDLLPSTGRQLRLARLLGRTSPPRYLHHPLVRDREGRKVSKRDFGKALRDHRADGRTPESLLGEAAHLGGLLPAPRPLTVTELPTLFAR